MKNVTLLEEDTIQFPDAVTTRGLKHLRELAGQASLGHRAVLLLVIQRAGGRVFRPAQAIDPDWAAGLRAVIRRGVEVLAWRFRVAPEGIHPFGPVALEL